MTFEMKPHHSVLPGKLDQLDEDVTIEKVKENRFKSGRQSMRVNNVEFQFDDVKSLDSEEELCDLVDEKNGHDRHFFC